MNTEKLSKSFESFIKDSKTEISISEKLMGRLIEAFEEVVELATDKYNEGEDYYAGDYLSQRLSFEEKQIIQDVCEGAISIFDCPTVLRKLIKKVESFKYDLKSDNIEHK